ALSSRHGALRRGPARRAGLRQLMLRHMAALGHDRQAALVPERQAAAQRPGVPPRRAEGLSGERRAGAQAALEDDRAIARDRVGARPANVVDWGAMPLVVDGMNVIGSRPDGWWRDRRGAQRALVQALGALGEPVTVVFDGAPHDVDAPDEVEVAFAPHADD